MKRGNSAQAPGCPKEPCTLVKQGQFNLLLSYSVQLQHYEDFDTFSACWIFNVRCDLLAYVYVMGTSVYSLIPKEPRTLVKKGQICLLSYGVHLQHYEDFDTFSACWIFNMRCDLLAYVYIMGTSVYSLIRRTLVESAQSLTPE